MHAEPDIESINAAGIAAIDLQAFLTGPDRERQAIARQVDDICKSIGFLIIENHGVPANIIDNAWSATRSFFAQPLREKSKAISTDPHCPRGYFPLAAEALARSRGVDTPPDMKESFGIGPLRAPECQISATDFEFHFGENLWPDKPNTLRTTLTAYFTAMEKLGTQVLTLFAAALKLPPNYFEPFHTHPMCALRCINYPAADQPLLPEQKGAGEHSDYGSITLLKSDPDVPGLEIRLPSGAWAKAPLVRNAFIVNIGDMLARWTNGRWVSTLHRVATPATDSGVVRRRQSIAFFHNPNYNARIECIATCLKNDEKPKYAPVQAGKYLLERFTSAVA